MINNCQVLLQKSEMDKLIGANVKKHRQHRIALKATTTNNNTTSNEDDKTAIAIDPYKGCKDHLSTDVIERINKRYI